MIASVTTASSAPGMAQVKTGLSICLAGLLSAVGSAESCNAVAVQGPAHLKSEEPSWKLVVAVAVLVLLLGISLGGHIAKWTADAETTEPEAKSRTSRPSSCKSTQTIRPAPIEKFDFNELTVEALRDRLFEAGQSRQGTKEYLKIRQQQFYKNKGVQPIFEAND